MKKNRRNGFEWDVPGWRIDENAPGASIGIILGVTRDPGSVLRIGASKPPRAAVTFGALHTLTVTGGENILSVPGHEEYVGLSDRAAAREAMEAFRHSGAAP